MQAEGAVALGKLGKYERVDVLGHGVSGIVYLAWDTLLRKQVALKEIDVQAADFTRFLEEARVMDRLNHPHIVRVNGVEVIEGRVVIDMEYVKGQNLQELLRVEGRLPIERALDIAIQTLDALDYAHQMHTVHRDIKPANILISRAGEVKLVDFGLAEILATNAYAGGAGTYAYMAPEDFAEEHHSDHQSDIWAVGVTLYEMLTGRRPFEVAKSKDPFAWRRVLMTENPAPLPSFLPPLKKRGWEGTASEETASEAMNWPPGLQAVLDRALARDKQVRYDSAAAFRDDLIAVQAGRQPLHAGSECVEGTWIATMPLFGEPAQAVVHTFPSFLPMDTPNSGGALAVATQNAPPPAPRTLPDRCEAQPVEQTAPKSRSKIFLFRRHKEVLPARVCAEPELLYFGEVRKGDERTLRFMVRVEGGEGKVSGRVIAAPMWVSVAPAAFYRRKQTLTVTAHSERVWQTGDFEDRICVETTAGSVQVPVGIRVLKPRRRFAEVAHWYIPLLMAVLLPVLTLAWGVAVTPAWVVQVGPVQHLVPSAALGSALLAMMFLLVAAEADLGPAEKLACGVLMAMMSMLLGFTVERSLHTPNPESLRALLATGVPIGATLMAQVLNRKYWKLWAGAIVLLSVLAAASFLAAFSAE
jgi:predicted Ser/Thr protein kinase